MADRTLADVESDIEAARTAIRTAMTSPASIGSRRGQVTNRSLKELQDYLQMLQEEKAALEAADGTGPVSGQALAYFPGD